MPDQDEINVFQQQLNDLINQKEQLLATKTSIEKETIELSLSKDTLTTQVNELINSKSELESKIETLTVKSNELSQNNETLLNNNSELQIKVNELTQKESEISKRITDLSSTHTTLNNEIVSLNRTISDISTALKTNTEENSNLLKDISEHTKEKNKLEKYIDSLKIKAGLYSHDLEGVGNNNKSQRRIYFWSSFVIYLFMVSLIVFLISSLILPELLSLGILGKVEQNNELYNLIVRRDIVTIISIKTPLIISLFFLIYLIYNLGRGFISQYIIAQEKMYSITLLDFLIQRIQKDNIKIPDAQRLDYETKLIDKQIKLLEQYLPNLLQHHGSQFEKITTSKQPLELTKDIIETVADKVGDNVLKAIKSKIAS